MTRWKNEFDDLKAGPIGFVHDWNVLVFYSNTNVQGRKDATGAFIPEAREFRKCHGIPKENFIGIKCPKVKLPIRREQVFSKIEEIGSQRPINSIAFFGHGWPQGIQFGIRRGEIPKLVELLAEYATNDVRLVLYACLAAENDVRDKEIGKLGPATDGGFADELRDNMVRAGISNGIVDAHKTAGHTSWNPYVVRFLCSDVVTPEYGGTGGAWLVEPRSESWRSWVKALKDKKRGLRYRFPYMSQYEILSELVFSD